MADGQADGPLNQAKDDMFMAHTHTHTQTQDYLAENAIKVQQTNRATTGSRQQGAGVKGHGAGGGLG